MNTDLLIRVLRVNLWLILRDARIDVLGPGGDAAFQVDQPTRKARALQRFDRFRTAHPALAMNDRIHALIDLVHARDDVAQRDQLRSRYARDLELVRLPHVDDLNLVATQTTRIQLSRADLFELRIRRRKLMRRHSAKLFVIDQSGNRRVLAADRTLRILS